MKTGIRASTSTAAHPRWPRNAPPPALVNVRRGGVVESRHRGAIVQVSADLAVERALGDPDTVVTLRSAVKPFALVALIESGAADAFHLTRAGTGRHGRLALGRGHARPHAPGDLPSGEPEPDAAGVWRHGAARRADRGPPGAGW